MFFVQVDIDIDYTELILTAIKLRCLVLFVEKYVFSAIPRLVCPECPE